MAKGWLGFQGKHKNIRQAFTEKARMSSEKPNSPKRTIMYKRDILET